MSARPLRLNLTLPILRIGIGPFTLDPLEQLVGAKVTDLLGALMIGPVGQRRCERSGVNVDVYPLALPDGEGASVPLGHLGELGFFNDTGIVALTVPAATAAWMATRLGDMLVSGPQPVDSVDGRSRVAILRVRLRPGARASFPLGRLGEVGVEAA